MGRRKGAGINTRAFPTGHQDTIICPHGVKEETRFTPQTIAKYKVPQTGPREPSNTAGRAPRPSLLPLILESPQTPSPPFSSQTLNPGSQAQMPSPQVNMALRSVTMGKQKDYHSSQQPQTPVKAKVRTALDALLKGRQRRWCLSTQLVFPTARLPEHTVAVCFICLQRQYGMLNM